MTAHRRSVDTILHRRTLKRRSYGKCDAERDCDRRPLGGYHFEVVGAFKWRLNQRHCSTHGVSVVPTYYHPNTNCAPFKMRPLISPSTTSPGFSVSFARPGDGGGERIGSGLQFRARATDNARA